MSWLRLAPVFVFVTLLACKKDDAAAENNGVNDVRLACQVRARWTAPMAEKCAQCKGVAALDDCGCEALKDFGAKCAAQGKAKRAEPSCTAAIDDCVRACANDCDCADRCYTDAPNCKPLAAAESGCVAEVCTPYCEADGG